MTIKSTPMKDAEPVRQRGPQIGVLRASSVERAFVALLYLAVGLLALLSVFGTFYGLQGRTGPLGAPWTMPGDAAALPLWFGGALVVQLVLTLLQWGARQMARRDPRWWIVYLVALVWSVYYNWVAYFDPAVALGVPWLAAAAIIIGSDAIPEFMVVRKD